MPQFKVTVSQTASDAPEKLYENFFKKVWLPPIEDQSYFVKFTKKEDGDPVTRVGSTREVSLGMIEKITAADFPNWIEYQFEQAGCISPASNYKGRVEFKPIEETKSTEIIWSGSFETSNITSYFLNPLLKSMYKDFIAQLTAADKN